MALKTNFSVRDRVLVVRPKREIDHHESLALRSEWQRQMEENTVRHVLLNLNEVDFMDSSGIGVILGRYKEVTAQGGELVVCQMTEPVERLFRMAGLHKVIRVEKNEEVALLSLGVAS